MRVLFDTNVVLDLLLARAPFEQEAKRIWDALDEERIIGFVPASALTDIFYIARKQVGREMALDAVQTCFDSLEICTVDSQAIQKALSLPGIDFEDNLQEACAVIYELDAIVTRDKAGFKRSSIPVMTPTEVLAQLASTG